MSVENVTAERDDLVAGLRGRAARPRGTAPTSPSCTSRPGACRTARRRPARTRARSCRCAAPAGRRAAPRRPLRSRARRARCRRSRSAVSRPGSPAHPSCSTRGRPLAPHFAHVPKVVARPRPLVGSARPKERACCSISPAAPRSSPARARTSVRGLATLLAAQGAQRGRQRHRSATRRKRRRRGRGERRRSCCRSLRCDRLRGCRRSGARDSAPSTSSSTTPATPARTRWCPSRFVRPSRGVGRPAPRQRLRRTALHARGSGRHV